MLFASRHIYGKSHVDMVEETTVCSEESPSPSKIGTHPQKIIFHEVKSPSSCRFLFQIVSFSFQTVRNDNATASGELKSS
jgi:hypothetical protein